MINKNFFDDIKLFESKLKNKEPFSFLRYSDGELFIMQGKNLTLNSNGSLVENQFYPIHWDEEDHKEINAEKDSKIKDMLIESYKFNYQNYFKGISCKCCVGEENNKFFLDLSNDTEHLTWANLFVNGNYPYYLSNILPLFSNYEVILIANEKTKIENLPFKVKKFFKIGKNCIINDLHLVNTITNYIKENNINNHLFLFSASSLSQILIYNLFKENKNNTYLNVGTTLNHLFGISCNRGYLSYHSDKNHPDIKKMCIW